MKRLRNGVALAAAALTIGCSGITETVPGAGEEPGGEAGGGPGTGTGSDSALNLDPRVTQAYTGFGLDLFRRVADQAGDANVFVSPTSIAFALAMTQNGAAGATLEAMARAMGTEGLSRDAINQANAVWLASLQSPDPKVELSIANSLWARQGVPLLPDFVERSRTVYRAEVATLDFASPQAARTINDWVSRSTGGRIPEIVAAEIDPSTVLFLINAIHFKGSWSKPFDPRLTREGDWHLPGGATKRVPMMHRDGRYRTFRADGVQGLALPYGGGRLAMYILLPDTGSSLASLRRRLSAAEWARWQDRFQEGRVMVTIPRFRLEYELALNEPLKAMGMAPLFDPARADLSGMFPREYLAVNNAYVSNVKHKTFLEVNELGTEAAGATSVEVGVTSLPPTFVVDRPFLVAIQDNRTGTVLFLGQIADP